MTTSLLPAPGIAVAALYFSRHIGLQTDVFPVETTGGTLVASLVGLLLIFTLYIAFKQRELRGLRTNLLGEQLEREGGKVWTERKLDQSGFWSSLPADSIHSQVDQINGENLPRAA